MGHCVWSLSIHSHASLLPFPICAHSVEVIYPIDVLEVVSGGARLTAVAMEKVGIMSPLAGVGDHQRAKYPPVRTIKFGTFSRKPTPGMMAVGGLPAEMVLHMLISTRILPQYGELFASHGNSTIASV